MKRSRIHLVGALECAKMLGVHKSNFLRDHSKLVDFPQPIADLACGRIWLREDVEAYVEDWRRRRKDKAR